MRRLLPAPERRQLLLGAAMCLYSAHLGQKLVKPMQVLIVTSVMLTFIPLAFMAAVPTAVLLGKPVPLLGDWAGPAALLAGPVLAGLAGLFWRYGINKYQGAGG